MTKAAIVTQAAIKRAIRAAQIEGASMIEVLPDGTIRVLLRKDYQLSAEELAADRQPAQTGDGWTAKA